MIDAVSIGDVENAILAVLAAAGDAGVLGYRYGDLSSYPLDFSQYILSEQRRFPAAWVVWQAWGKAKLRGDGSYQVLNRFGLVLGARSLRNETATRQGSAGQVGSYQLLNDACALLANQTLGLPIDPLRIGQARTLFNAKLQTDRKVNLIVLDLDTNLYLPAAPSPYPAPSIVDFTTFNVSWDIPPFIGVQPGTGELPAADADAKAYDIVTLPESESP
jgi:phage gp37-like protein